MSFGRPSSPATAVNPRVRPPATRPGSAARARTRRRRPAPRAAAGSLPSTGRYAGTRTPTSSVRWAAFASDRGPWPLPHHPEPPVSRKLAGKDRHRKDDSGRSPASRILSPSGHGPGLPRQRGGHGSPDGTPSVNREAEHRRGPGSGDPGQGRTRRGHARPPPTWPTRTGSSTGCRCTTPAWMRWRGWGRAPAHRRGRAAAAGRGAWARWRDGVRTRVRVPARAPA